MSTSFAAGADAPEIESPEFEPAFETVAELVDDTGPDTAEEDLGQGFVELGASDAVVAALAARGVVTPFEIQARVIPDAIAGRDILARSRTGSGKTLAFAIPIVERLEGAPPKPAAVVLVPTRELASQVSEEFAAIAKPKGLRVAAVYGGVGLAEQARSASRAQIIVAIPGRLFDLIERGSVTLAEIRIFVLD